MQLRYILSRQEQNEEVTCLHISQPEARDLPSSPASGGKNKNRNVMPLKQRKAALEKSLQRRSHSTAIVFTWLQCEHCIGVEGHRRQNRTSSGTSHAGLVVAVPLGMCCSGRLERSRRLAKAESSYYLATSTVLYWAHFITSNRYTY